MKPHRLATIVTALFLTAASSAFARPLDFRELSLLVRAHESESSILSIAAQRKLVRPLTPPQEATLRSQGAPDSLIRELRNSSVVLSQNEAAAFESAASAPAAPQHTGELGRRKNIEIIDVTVDQPINLSVWGGPDVEFAFRARDIVETGRSEVEMIQPTSTTVHYATYRGIRVPGWEPVDPEYTSVVAHSFARPLHIDWSNPLRIGDVPYLLYPVYALRGVALYYVGRMSDDVVRLAVISG